MRSKNETTERLAYLLKHPREPIFQFFFMIAAGIISIIIVHAALALFDDIVTLVFLLTEILIWAIGVWYYWFRFRSFIRMFQSRRPLCADASKTFIIELQELRQQIMDTVMDKVLKDIGGKNYNKAKKNVHNHLKEETLADVSDLTDRSERVRSLIESNEKAKRVGGYFVGLLYGLLIFAVILAAFTSFIPSTLSYTVVVFIAAWFIYGPAIVAMLFGVISRFGHHISLGQLLFDKSDLRAAFDNWWDNQGT